MKNQIKYTVNGDSLDIKIAFELKDDFKKVFKGAKWDHKAKVWYVKNNTRNLNKLNKFMTPINSELAKEALVEIDDKIRYNNEVIDRCNATPVEDNDYKFALSSKRYSEHCITELTEKRERILKLIVD